jgi:hypothetical protein
MKKNLTSLSEFIDEEIGAKGTQKRDKFDSGLNAFKSAALARQAKDLKRKGQ